MSCPITLTSGGAVTLVSEGSTITLSTALIETQPPLVYDTEVLLLAATPPTGSLGFATDTEHLFYRGATAWQQVTGLPPVTGNDGYALIEIGSVPAFRPIKESYVVAAFAINSFNGPGVQEVGQTLTNPAFTASYNRLPTTAGVQDNQGNPAQDVTSTPTAFSYLHAYTKTANNATVSWTLSGVESGDPASRAVSTSWRPRVFYGVGVDGYSTESDIESLANQPLSASRAMTFTVTAGSGQHIYFAAPTSYGTPTFYVGGFEGGFVLVGAISVTNAYGVTQNFDLWKSINPNLGVTTVTVS